MSEREDGYQVVVWAFDLDAEAREALFDRVAEAAHALDEQVTCSGGPGDAALAHIAAVLRDEATVEAVARALHVCEAGRYDLHPAAWDGLPTWTRTAYLERATAASRALAERLGVPHVDR